MLRGKHWTNVLEGPAVFEDCEIDPLLTESALSRIGSDLSNCLGEHYAQECASGKAHIFCIRNASGALLGALHLRFHVARHGGFEVGIRDCKGPRNTRICARGKRAVAAFCDWLKTAEAQRRISELPRMRLALSTVEFRERFEMESTVVALRRLRQKSIRFDTLRNKVWDMLASTTVQATVSTSTQTGRNP